MKLFYSIFLKENSINASIKFITTYGKEMNLPYQFTFEDLDEIVLSFNGLETVRFILTFS
jgi:hypothetical protein